MGTQLPPDQPPTETQTAPTAPPKKLLRTILVGASFALVLGLFYESLALGGVVNFHLAHVFLLAAWGVSVFAIYTAEPLSPLTARHRMLITIIGAGAVGLVCIWFYTLEEPATTVQTGNAPAADGAKVEIEAMDADRLKDGSYYFPIQLTNDGPGDISNYQAIFTQHPMAEPMGFLEENAFMAQPENLLRNMNLTLSSIKQFTSSLDANRSVVERETKLKFDEPSYHKIISGGVLLYYGFVLVYKDATSDSEHTLYYAERCMHYDANLSDYVNCSTGHNFSKAKWPPE